MRIALLFCFLCVGCNAATSPSAPVSPIAPSPPRFFLPTIVDTRSYNYSVDADRTFIAAHAGRPHLLRDRRTGVDTPLPPASLEQIGPHRQHVLVQQFAPGSKGYRVYDIDPTQPALRLLYEGAAAYHLKPIGVDGDRLFFVVHRANESRIVTLWPTGSRQETILSDSAGPAGFDLVRGPRVLLVGRCLIDGTPYDLFDKRGSGNVTARVYVHHLDTGERRDIGECIGGWIHAGLNRPFVRVGWITAAELERSDPTTRPLTEFSPGSYVVEETEALIVKKVR